MTERALELLAAAGPHEAYPQEMDLYGQFVGTWRVHNRYYDEHDGEWHENTREWAFGWVLDGRGVQDVLRADDGGIGATVRVYDAKLGAWRVHWFGASAGDFGVLTGRRHGEEIWQDGAQHDGRLIRWNFSDITSTSFRWRGYISDDEGATWRLEQEMRAQR